jgi:hypothetical protein
MFQENYFQYAQTVVNSFTQKAAVLQASQKHQRTFLYHFAE